MKRWRWLVPLLAAAVLFAGCKRSQFAGNLGDNLREWEEAGEAPAPIEPSEVVTCENGDFSDALGFEMSAYPDHDGMRPVKYFAIDGWFAQVEFKTADERTLSARFAKEGGGRLDGTHLESHNLDVRELSIDGQAAEVRYSTKGCMLVTWVRDGFQYNVHSSENNIDIPDSEIEELVKTLRCTLAE